MFYPFSLAYFTFCSLFFISEELRAKKGSIPVRLVEGAPWNSVISLLTELFLPRSYTSTRFRGDLFVEDGVDMLFVESLRFDPEVQAILTPAGLELLCSYFEPRQPEELGTDAMYNDKEEEALALLDVFKLSLGKALSVQHLILF